MRNTPLLLLATAMATTALIGCAGEEPSPSPTEPPATPTATATATATEIPTPTACIDEDGDGSCLAVDCDDADASRAPDLAETCDEIDNDCDESVDEGALTTFYPDGDGDGTGVGEGAVEACEVPEGFAAVSGDCDDTKRSVYPGRADGCDGLDNDCDEAVDEAPDLTVYTDADGDGYGTGGAPGCAATEGQSLVGGDCVDSDASINPGAQEIWGNDIDEDCTGADAVANAYVLKTGEPPHEEDPTFSFIQDAIDEAPTGFTIAVGPGTYPESINFSGKDLKIISMEGPESTIIDATGIEGPVVLFNNAEGTTATARLEGFTLTGGTGSDGAVCGFVTSLGYGGAICIAGADPEIVGNIIVDNSVSGSGGAIYVEDSEAVFMGNIIEGNFADYDAGGLNISGSPIVLADNLIAGNTARRSGGGMVVYESAAHIFGNVIAFNGTDGRAAPQGGGVYVSDSDVLLENNIIAHNTSGSSGGGIGVLNSAVKGTIRGNTIVGNEAEVAGGGVQVNGGTQAVAGGTTMTGNIVAFNESPTGANLQVDNAGRLTTDYSVFWLISGASGLVGHTLSSTDRVGDPAFVNDPGNLKDDDDDYHLKAGSAAIDAADPDPAFNDVDGTRGDAGAYGGPLGGDLSFSLTDAAQD